MIEFLEEIDYGLVLAINGWHSPLLDEVMWIVSGKLTWIPLYVALVVLGWVKLPRKTFFIYFFTVVGSVALADVISAQFIKEYVMRYRPSHNLVLAEQLHFYEFSDGTLYKGGQYGFVSSHAANFFAIAITAGISLRKEYKWLLGTLLGIACLVGFSRVYLGVHYVSDVVAGGIVGACVGYLCYRLVYLRRKRV